MTRKTTQTPKSPAQPPVWDDIAPELARQILERRETTRELLRPSTLAANTIDALKFMRDQADVHALTVALREQAHLVTDKDDLSRAEAMLICQATTLDALFCSLTRRAVAQDMLHPYEVHFRLALRAQAQCRATLETLAAIKNPPVLIAKQANIAHGPQQVNNGTLPTGEPSRAREAETAQNKLLEKQNGERLDTLTACAASGADPAMGTLGEGDRADVRRRQGAVRAQCLEGRQPANAARAGAGAASAT